LEAQPRNVSAYRSCCCYAVALANYVRVKRGQDWAGPSVLLVRYRELGAVRACARQGNLASAVAASIHPSIPVHPWPEFFALRPRVGCSHLGACSAHAVGHALRWCLRQSVCRSPCGARRYLQYPCPAVYGCPATAPRDHPIPPTHAAESGDGGPPLSSTRRYPCGASPAAK